MLAEEEGRRLHDRATRGIELTAAEQYELQQWYDCRDARDSESCGVIPTPDRVETLRTEVGQTLLRMQAVAQQIAAQAVENDRLRGENARLEQELRAARPLTRG